MAAAVGISHHSVHTIWQKNDLKPHQTRTFKISRDKHFAEKFWDVMGLYLDPPEKALVLCCDEKSQCQALERTRWNRMEAARLLRISYRALRYKMEQYTIATPPSRTG